jgi:glycosyltransferase involved in cell wall biosynthesis
MRERISVIVPVYNGAHFIAEALRSIIAQTRLPDEIIVVDDGSTDATAGIAASYGGGALRYVYQSHQGAQHARNHGLRLAQGDLIAFLDADDIWIADKLERQLALAANADIVIGMTRIMNDESNEPFIFPSLCCALVWRSAFQQIGTFDPSLPYSDDLDWYMRAREEGLRFILHRDVVLYHRRHADNITNNHAARDHYHLLMLKKSIERRRQQGIAALPKLSNFFAGLPEAE